MIDFIMGNLWLAVLAELVIIGMDFLFLKRTIKVLGEKQVVGSTVLVALISFLLSAYVAIFCSGYASDKNGAFIFSVAFGLNLILVAFSSYLSLFIAGKKEMREKSIKKVQIIRKYYGSNPILGFALGHNSFGIFIFLIGIGNFYYDSFVQIVPKNQLGSVVGMVVIIIYIFVLPIYLIYKIPGWFESVLERIK